MLRMAFDRTDLKTLAERNELIVCDARPTRRNVDIHVWDPNDLTGWMDAAHHAGAAIVYVEPVTFADHVEQLRNDLDQLEAVLGDDAELTALDLQLADIADAHRDENVGWQAEWRRDGVAHVFLADVLPPALHDLAAIITTRRDALPTGRELRSLRYDTVNHQLRARNEERQGRTDAAIDALVEHPDFPACKSEATRKQLLRSLGIDLTGLNVGDIVTLARDRYQRGTS
jgi:hypothetical protein